MGKCRFESCWPLLFHGSIPPDLRAIISEHAAAWNVKAIHVGCSGNLTIERVLEGKVELHGNDVTLYSCAIGRHVAGDPLPITLKEPRLEWLQPYMQTPDARLATLLLGSANPSPFAKLDSDRPFYVRMRAAYQDQWPVLHAKTQAKVEAATLKLASFHIGDVVDWAASLPKTAAIICYPPFYSGDYEQQFKTLDDVFDWPRPEYPEFDEDRHAQLLATITGRKRWMYGTYQRRDDLDEFLVGLVQTTNRGLPLYVYGSGAARISRPRQITEPVLTPRLGPADELGDTLTLAPLTGPQFSTLRSQYMNPNIRPGAPLLPVGVLCDGKLIGAFALSLGTFGADAYLLSDFPVTGSRYERLSRLIVAAALSEEARFLMERSTSRRMHTISTTAFSQNPVSMKYRGLLRLAKRSDSDDPLYRYQLQYMATMGESTLAEALAAWKAKHAKKIREPARA